MRVSREALNSNWLRYFEKNHAAVLRLSTEEYRLSGEEKQRIASSIAAFQIGEASEGKHLRDKAARYCGQRKDAIYPRILELFIKEENRHSAYLGWFMREQGIAKKRTTWTDRIFRAVRSLATLEVSLRVLVTAEMIALVYYQSLARATGSPALKTICARMLDEEREHVRFQMANLHWMNVRRFPLFAAWVDIAQALFLFFTCGAVWIEHRGVLKGDCGGFRGFVAKVWDVFREAMDHGFADATGESGAAAIARTQPEL